MEKQKQSTPECLSNYLIGGCKYSSKTDELQLKYLKENGPRIPLTGVKIDLYNPVLRSLRRYDIENVQGKLVDELSRKTFPLELVTLLQNSDNHTFDPPKIIYPGYDLLSLTQSHMNHENNDDEPLFLKNSEISESWKTYLDSLPLTKTKIETNKLLFSSLIKSN